MLDLVLHLAAGVLAGCTAALFGLGGGLAVVPILYISLPHLGINHAELMHVAVGTSLTVMVVTAIDSAYSHHRRGDVLWPVVALIAPTMALGAAAAALASQFIPTHWLRYLFIALVAFVIFRALTRKGFTAEYALADAEPIPRALAAVFGLFNGALAALLGSGGGPLTVPFLRRFKLPMVNAAGISSTLSAPVALCGSIGFMVAGGSDPSRPAWSTGYVYWPAVAGLAIGILVGVPIGTKLSHYFSDKQEARLYVAFLIVILVVMVL
ncbi:MAG: sulfite exporter TauE/SafE family protein [Pseudomonadota bacterium]